MLTKEQSFKVVKAIAKGTWNNLPAILSVIPATAIAGKVLVEVKKIADEVKASGKAQEEAVNKLIEECGGEAEFKKKLHDEVKSERDTKNPKYINAAIFCINGAEGLSDEEQEKLVDTLTGEAEAETGEIARFVDAFCEDYFASDHDSCDCPIEIGQEYIAFNFDDMSDHPYDEEDLQIIMDELNKILGRAAFSEYESLGTDDSCEY